MTVLNVDNQLDELLTFLNNTKNMHITNMMDVVNSDVSGKKRKFQTSPHDNVESKKARTDF